MSERLPSDRPGASSLHGDRGELEVTVSTVRLEELFAAVRRHVRLVVGVVLATVAAAGVVAYVTGPAYRAVAVIRMSDPRRALTAASCWTRRVPTRGSPTRCCRRRSCSPVGRLPVR